MFGAGGVVRVRVGRYRRTVRLDRLHTSLHRRGDVPTRWRTVDLAARLGQHRHHLPGIQPIRPSRRRHLQINATTRQPRVLRRLQHLVLHHVHEHRRHDHGHPYEVGSGGTPGSVDDERVVPRGRKSHRVVEELTLPAGKVGPLGVGLRRRTCDVRIIIDLAVDLHVDRCVRPDRTLARLHVDLGRHVEVPRRVGTWMNDHLCVELDSDAILSAIEGHRERRLLHRARHRDARTHRPLRILILGEVVRRRHQRVDHQRQAHPAEEEPERRHPIRRRHLHRTSKPRRLR